MYVRKIAGWVVLLSLGACAGPDSNQDQQVAVAPEIGAVPLDACPASSFGEFLKIYASNATVRAEFTEPSVAVADYKEPDSLDEQVLIVRQVSKGDYKDFTLRYEQDAFHNIDAAGEVDPAAVDVTIVARGPNYFVSYVYAMSEGNSWVFRERNNCWYLAEDPDPPSA